MTETVTTRQLAAILGISIQRINELGRKGKIHRRADSGWDLVEVNTNLRENLDKRQALRSLGQTVQSEDPAAPSEQDYSGPSKPLNLMQAQLKHELAKASKTEFEVAKMRGILIDAEEAATEWQRQILAARKHALQLPGKLAPKVAVESDVLICQHLIEREIRAMLSELSEYRANA
jgi:hypothetical protein